MMESRKVGYRLTKSLGGGCFLAGIGEKTIEHGVRYRCPIAV